MGLEYLIRRTRPLTMAPSAARHLHALRSAGRSAPTSSFTSSRCRSTSSATRCTASRPSRSAPCNLQADLARLDPHAQLGDPTDKPIIAPNYLATTRTARSPPIPMRVTRRLMKQEALAPYRPEEYLPGPVIGDDAESLAKAAGDIGTTIFHPVGTAKMGLASDPLAVVDERLRVIGIDGLRVADASVMPTITSGNTNTPTLMIAEKGAGMVIADAR
jgi:choline dehydrogenase